MTSIIQVPQHAAQPQQQQSNSNFKKWQPHENDVIAHHVRSTPNLSEAFRLAVLDLPDRTYSSVSAHYYDLNKQKTKKAKKSAAKHRQEPAYQEHYQNGNGHEPNGRGYNGAVVVYNKSKRNAPAVIYDDSEVFETILMLIPKLNPGRKRQLVEFLFPS